MIKKFKEFLNENNDISQKENIDYDDYRVLDNFLDSIDFSNVTKESSDRQYVDYRLIVRESKYGDLLFDTSKRKRLSEGIHTTYDIEKVRDEIVNKYLMEDWQFIIADGCNEIKVAIVIPMVGENDDMVKSDIENLGYYESNRRLEIINDKKYFNIQFNPRYPKCVNNEVGTMSCILHLTPKYNLESIMKNGFIPQHKNEKYTYPDRLHFIKGNVTEHEIVNIGQQLCDINNNPENDGTYVLFTLSVDKIPRSVKFIGDACYEMGICTEEKIPYDVVISMREYKFLK